MLARACESRGGRPPPELQTPLTDACADRATPADLDLVAALLEAFTEARCAPAALEPRLAAPALWRFKGGAWARLENDGAGPTAALDVNKELVTECAFCLAPRRAAPYPSGHPYRTRR